MNDNNKNRDIMNNNKKKWGYTESVTVSFGLLISALGLQIFGIKLPVFSSPENIYIGISFILILLVSYIFFKKRTFVVWLHSIPAAICSIVLFTFLSILMGLFPQVENSNVYISKIGLNKITSTWFYLFSFLFFITSLGMTILKRLFNFKKSDFGFIFNHFGLWLAVFSANLGSGDVQRLIMNLYENKTNWIAIDENEKKVEMPMAIKLKKFWIEEYPPKLLVIDNNTGKIINLKKKNEHFLIESENSKGKIGDINIEVLKFYKESKKFDDRFVKVHDMGSAPSVLIKIENGDIKKEGWVSCGSFLQMPASLKINNEISIVMSVPEAKKYSSDLKIYTKSEQIIDTNLIVNHPINIENWEMYQISYDEKKGKWSNLSVIELVKDPWLPLVYTGIFLMIIGTGFLFWRGEKLKH
ncbi:MAG: hypothetical protein B6I24_08690 [Bacteroidetes bacterium 4572_128]|nr:MAG: hypothetical protein B6I24_08690 [Bacteroidetes bacterium 4572_128]